MVLNRRLHGVGCHEGATVAPQKHVVRVGLRVVAFGDGDGTTSTARHTVHQHIPNDLGTWLDSKGGYGEPSGHRPHGRQGRIVPG